MKPVKVDRRKVKPGSVYLNKKEKRISFITPGIYRHYAGKLYYVFFTARHRETDEELVIYMPMYAHKNGGHVPQACPLGMWFDLIDQKLLQKKHRGLIVTRFTYVGATLPPNTKEIE